VSVSIENPRVAGRKGRTRPGDRIFAGLSTGAGLAILTVLAGVAAFLIVKAWPAITAPGAEIGDEGNGLVAYIWPLLFGTILAAAIAIMIALPLAVAVALFISHFAPPKLAQPLSYAIDMLAAIPSIIYGLWGIVVLGPASVGLQKWLAAHLGFIPFFDGPATSTGRTMFVAGLVLAVMILPIITAISRSVFSQTPRKLQEGALALGATRWEMIRLTVLPFGRSAMISAAMLGLGRALGETMAVAIILSVSGGVSFNLISSANPSTIAANVALEFPESSGLDINVLIASGLVLFAVTLLINMAARRVINREVTY
jgi:phosphate transport system permease protein